jgi:RNA polymerase sigma-70 factor (ECF subfamily)
MSSIIRFLLTSGYLRCDGRGEAESSLVRKSAAVEDDLALAQAGDGDAFTRMVEPLRNELHAHCYRILGSAHDADDALQEVLLRAWRGLARFEGRSSLRTWLYTIATRTCLDVVEQRGRRALPVDLGPSSEAVVMDDGPATDVAWLGPYPDGQVAAGGTSPSARYEQREAVELAFVAALQHLGGNQRAALLLFDVLGFTVAEIASMMDTSTASVNSALARARRVVAAKVPAISQQRTLSRLDDAQLRRVVDGYATALQNRDVDVLIALLTEDVTWSMPPHPHWYQGLPAVLDFATRLPLSSCGQWRTLNITANGQPAVASYLSRDGVDPYPAWAVNVLTLRDDRVADITSFIGLEHFIRLGLPVAL